jgi:polyisoprenyl-teichoic acid--peptidoglycan teichoic acid transferase
MQENFPWKKVSTIVFYTGIFLVGFTFTYSFLQLSKIFVKNPIRNMLPTPNLYAKATAKPVEQFEPEKQDKGTYNILLLGYGGANHDGGLLTDSIITVHVDTNNQSIAFVSIPRDFWIEGNKKINSAGTPGFQNSMPVVSGITGLPVNFFVAADFSGFSKIIDNLEGITVQVPAAFDDPFYPITGEENNVCGKTNEEIEALKVKYSGYALETQFTCRYEHLHFDQGDVKLDGATALKFVRSRHGDSDFGRSARQFAVLKGISDKLISFQALGKFDSIVGTISQIVKTDLDAGTIKSLVQILGDPKAYTTKQIQLTTDNVLMEGKSAQGAYVLMPKAGNFNYTDIKSYITSQLK